MVTPINSKGKKILIIGQRADIVLMKEVISKQCVGVEVVMLDKISAEKDDLRRLAAELTSMSSREVRMAFEIQNLHKMQIEKNNTNEISESKRLSQQSWKNRPRSKR